jgi:MFS family permease
LILTSLLSALDISIVATSLPVIVAEFNAIQNISWIIAGYSLATAIAMPIYGRLVDKFGSAKMFLFSIVLFLVASTLCGLAQDIIMLSVSRVLQGFGGAGLSLLPVTIISGLIPERSRPKYIVPMISVWSIAGVAGPVLGGLLTATVGWRWIFWINLPLGLLAILLAVPALPRQDKLREGKPFGISTLVFFILSASSLVFALHSITEGLSGDLTFMATSAAFALLMISLFIWRTIKSDNPLIPIRAMNNRGAITVLILGTIGGASVFPLTGFVPTLLQMAYDVPSWLAGLSLVPLVAGVLSANIFSSRRLSKTGNYSNFYLVGSAIAAMSMFGIYFLSGQLGAVLIAAGLGLTGFGFGLFGQFTVTLAQSFSESRFLGSVTSTVMVSRDISGSVVATIAGGLFGFGVSQALLKLNLPENLRGISLQPSDLSTLSPAIKAQVQLAYFDAFHAIFLNSAVAYVLVFALALTLPKKELKAK